MCVGELAPGIALLLVNRDRVVELHVDAGSEEEPLELIAPWVRDHVEMVDVAVAGRLAGEHGAGARASPRVARRDFTAPVGPAPDVLELDAEHRRVQIVEPRVVAEGMDRALERAVVPEPSNRSVDVLAVRHHGPAVA